MVAAAFTLIKPGIATDLAGLALVLVTIASQRMIPREDRHAAAAASR